MTKRHSRFMAARRDDFPFFCLFFMPKSFITHFLCLYSKENISFFKQQKNLYGTQSFCNKIHCVAFFVASKASAKRSHTNRGATIRKPRGSSLGPFHQTVLYRIKIVGGTNGNGFNELQYTHTHITHYNAILVYDPIEN